MKIIKKSRIINLIIIISICFGAIPTYSISDLGQLPKKRSYKKSIILSLVTVATMGVVAALIFDSNNISSPYPINSGSIEIETLQPKTNKNLIIFSILGLGAIAILISALWEKKPSQYCYYSSDTGNNPSFVETHSPRENKNSEKPISCSKSLFSYEYYNNVNAIEKSLRRGIGNLEETDGDGNTPLMLACIQKKLDTIKVLIKFGANPHAKNKKDKTPIETLKKYVSKEGFNEMYYKKDNNKHFFCKPDPLWKTMPFNYINIRDIDTEYFVAGFCEAQRQNKFYTKNKVGYINHLTKFIYDEKTSQYDKQDLLIEIFDEYKNSKKDIPEITKTSLIRKILFNHRFFNEDQFKEVREYAMKNDLHDCHGNSFLMSAVRFSKDYNLVSKLAFDFMLKSYDNCSYSNNPQDKIDFNNKLEIIRDDAEALNEKLYYDIKKIGFIWNYLTTINLAKVMGKERLEPEIVKNIIELIGINGIKGNKTYCAICVNTIR